MGVKEREEEETVNKQQKVGWAYFITAGFSF